jgi:hypothetical protein
VPPAMFEHEHFNDREYRKTLVIVYELTARGNLGLRNQKRFPA